MHILLMSTINWFLSWEDGISGMSVIMQKVTPLYDTHKSFGSCLSGVTQCPIPAGGVYVYKFRLAGQLVKFLFTVFLAVFIEKVHWFH